MLLNRQNKISDEPGRFNEIWLQGQPFLVPDSSVIFSRDVYRQDDRIVTGKSLHTSFNLILQNLNQ